MRIYLAPMEGVIDHHLRYLLTRIGGIDWCTTEFIRVTEHTLPQKVFTRYAPELKSDHSGALCPIRVQLLGSHPTAIASNARKLARLGARGVDLNFGCPAKTVNRSNGGACLLNDTDLIARIVEAVREAIPTTTLSVKIRLGYEARDSGLRNAKAIEAAGADELIVHARSKADAYKPPAYWEEIAEISRALSIPVVANGEIWNLNDYIQCREQSRCEHVMLGRGMLAKPDLARQIRAHLSAKQFQAMPWSAVADVLYEFFLITKDQYPKKYMGNRVKQWLHYLKLNYPEAGRLFEEIKREKNEAVLTKYLVKHCKNI